MTDSDLKKLTLASAARLIRQSKEISPVELTEAVLDRIGRLNDRMRAFIGHGGPARTPGRQRQGGRASVAVRHGVPISLKDLYDTKGVRTTARSRVFADRVPSEDATVARKVREAGSVVVGKHNLHEFCPTASQPSTRTTVSARNPWNPDYISGGSSGGSASAVALSLGFGSLGSDTSGPFASLLRCAAWQD